MERGRAVKQERPRYPGEDLRPTSKKEIVGFYSYGWAAEVFVICGIGERRPRWKIWLLPRSLI